jgi:GT2 family glycosyltransferase
MSETQRFDPQIKVSVIVPVYNAEKTIGPLISTLRSQTIPPDEIILVDDGSSDGTKELILAESGVRYFSQENSGPATARNLGAEKSVNQLLFFTDSDCQPQKNWIEQGVKVFEDPQVSIISGSYGISNTKSLLARCIHSEIRFRHLHLMPDFPQAFGSYNFAIRKDAFLKVGGFDSQYRSASGEDNDLSYRLIKAGYRIRFNRQMLVNHSHQENWQKYLKEQFRHGYWRVKMYREHPSMAKGDDYTFWKDIAEVGLSLLAYISFLALFFHSLFLEIFLALNVLLAFVNLFYAMRMLPFLSEQFYWAGIMFLRAYSRALGFSSGILHLQFLFL